MERMLMSKIKKKSRTAMQKKSDRQLLLMCLPAILKVIIFSYIPMIGLVMAFQNYKPAYGIIWSPFVGWKHFEYLFASGSFARLLKNTIVLNLLFTGAGTLAGIFFGILLFEIANRFFVKFSQTVMFFPFFIAWPVVAAVLGAMVGDKGALTMMIFEATGNKINIYEMPQIWPFILTFMWIWKGAGLGAITYYAVLMNIDKELFESASIDGASRIKRIFAITLPTLKFMVVINLIMSTANILRMDFTMIFFLTDDRTILYPTTQVIETYMYKALRTQPGLFEPGVATGMIQGVAGLVLALVANKAAKLVDKESAMF